MDKKEILLISSDKDFADSLCCPIQDEFDVDLAEDGILAVEMLKNKDYYMILADEQCVDTSPLELLHRLSIIGIKEPIILTYQTEPKAEDILIAFEFGALDVICRGGSFDELVSAIKNK